MRVLHLDTGRDWRGGQAQVLHLARGLQSRGVESTIAAPEGPLLARARAAGVATAPWRARGDLDGVAVARLAQLVADVRPDLLHAHSAHAHVPAVVVGRGIRVPVVVARRVAVPVARNAWSRLKYSLPVDRYVCVSDAVRKSLRAAGIPEAKLVVIPSGVDVAALAPGGTVVDLRALVGAGPGDVVVGTIAALTAEKGHRHLIEAARALRDRSPRVHFVWIGEGGERAALERDIAAAGLGDRFHLLGFRTDARALLPQMTLAVLPSALEGLGTFLIEAQRLEVAVIGSAAGGIPEIIEHERTGLLVPPGDSAALAAAIARALDRPEERHRWVDEALRTSARFDVALTVDRTLALYRDLVAERIPLASVGSGRVRGNRTS